LAEAAARYEKIFVVLRQRVLKCTIKGSIGFGRKKGLMDFLFIRVRNSIRKRKRFDPVFATYTGGI